MIDTRKIKCHLYGHILIWIDIAKGHRYKSFAYPKCPFSNTNCWQRARKFSVWDKNSKLSCGWYIFHVLCVFFEMFSTCLWCCRRILWFDQICLTRHQPLHCRSRILAKPVTINLGDNCLVVVKCCCWLIAVWSKFIQHTFANRGLVMQWLITIPRSWYSIFEPNKTVITRYCKWQRFLSAKLCDAIQNVWINLSRYKFRCCGI